MERKYTNARDFLGKTATVKIDRALYTVHPKHGWAYELNYGFIPDTKSPDDEELDAYVIGIDEPVETFEGVCVAIIHRTLFCPLCARSATVADVSQLMGRLPGIVLMVSKFVVPPH